MATIAEIRQMLEKGDPVRVPRRYVAAVLEGLAAQARGTEQFRVVPRSHALSEIILERQG